MKALISSTGLYHRKHDVVLLSPDHSLLENHLFYSEEVTFVSVLKIGLFFFCGCIYSQEILINQFSSKEFAPYSRFLGGEIIRHAVGIAAAQLEAVSKQALFFNSFCISILDAFPWTSG